MLFLFSHATHASPLCPTSTIDGSAVAKTVTDGDTLHLTDGRKIRLIGINTPELGRNGRSHEPLALQAKKALRQILKSQNYRVDLRYGTTQKDRYGRHLMHLFLPDGSSVAARLLQTGLGAHIVIPDNVWNSGCHRRVEQQARKKQLGLWSPDRRTITDSQRITRASKGFKIVRGRITRIRRVKGLQILDMSGDLELVIKRNQQHAFPTHFVDRLINRTIEVRGWLYHYKGHPNMSLRHPHSVHIIDDFTP